MPASRPILQRMGFHSLVETTPWVYESAHTDDAIPAGSVLPSSTPDS